MVVGVRSKGQERQGRSPCWGRAGRVSTGPLHTLIRTKAVGRKGKRRKTHRLAAPIQLEPHGHPGAPNGPAQQTTAACRAFVNDVRPPLPHPLVPSLVTTVRRGWCGRLSLAFGNPGSCLATRKVARQPGTSRGESWDSALQVGWAASQRRPAAGLRQGLWWTAEIGVGGRTGTSTARSVLRHLPHL